MESVRERNDRYRRYIADAIGITDPSIVTNVIHSLVTARGDLTVHARDEVAEWARNAFRALYGREPTQRGVS